jgi:hypothetical protein
MRLFLSTSYIALMVSLTSIVYGNTTQNQDILDCIYELAETSIENVEQDKIFLRLSNLGLDNDQFYLVGDSGNTIFLSGLFSNEDGIYLKNEKQTILYICRTCTKTYRNYKPDRCERCLQDNFDVRFQ